MKIYSYSLATFLIEEVEVDYISPDGKRAIRSRTAGGNNTKVIFNFTDSEEKSKQIVKSFLQKEIRLRLSRVKKLQDALDKLI